MFRVCLKISVIYNLKRLDTVGFNRKQSDHGRKLNVEIENVSVKCSLLSIGIFLEKISGKFSSYLIYHFSE